MEVQYHGTIDEPDIRFKILNRGSSSAMNVGASSALRRILGLDVDPAPLQRCAAAERTIRATGIALRGMRPPRFPGPWSAGVILLRGLGRLDVFPAGDVGAARGLRTLMHLGPHAPLDPVIERFGDLRGYLYFCALGGWLLKKGLVHAAPQKERERRDSRLKGWT